MIITGIVLKGKGKGEQTGLKTANLDINLAPNLTEGLYTCQVNLRNKIYKGLLYYGYNSLSKSNCLEVHILNFNKNIYNQQITVEIKKYLRPPKKFKTIKELSRQIKKDLER